MYLFLFFMATPELQEKVERSMEEERRRRDERGGRKKRGGDIKGKDRRQYRGGEQR